MKDSTSSNIPTPHPGDYLRRDFMPREKLTIASLAAAMGEVDRAKVERLVMGKERYYGANATDFRWDRPGFREIMRDMERPNTVAGLIEKRRELVARLKLAKAEIKTLTAGIDALDQVIKLFAPEINGADAKPMRLPIPYAASKGEMQRAALDLLRETQAPITSRMVAERFCEARGFRPDPADYKAIRYRASNAMTNMRDGGRVRMIGKKGADVRWVLANDDDHP